MPIKINKVRLNYYDESVAVINITVIELHARMLIATLHISNMLRCLNLYSLMKSKLIIKTLFCNLTLFSLAIPISAGEAILKFHRTEENFANGDPIWRLELQQKGETILSWKAAASSKRHQQLDRRWAPGNGAPLPQGTYQVGKPEKWGNDIWLQLDPLFRTSRTGLGIHNCYPGVGCICIPDRKDLENLAKTVQSKQVNRLVVAN